eukprot:CAMPEP_0183739158 /NCGR_PEP_ID=MMETSP0737-20130205/56352_1 /TAXON_ID=385413 /ORGANISM="Thalassiosira miniscula, Strain CCMP1093" /LENGTH=925 /DNA_ID=CAMNT_0025973887 /DNA_START=159 /DNA_END=2936 /DNA_ORIENTATION=-
MTCLWTGIILTILITSQITYVDAFLSSTLFRAEPKLLVDYNFRTCRCRPLMGIKGFRSWFETTFPSAVVTINPDRPKSKNKKTKRNLDNSEPEIFDHVLIDANQFLHSTLRTAYNRRARRVKASMLNDGQQQLDDDIIEHCLLLFLKEINRIATTTAVPRRSLVIALDGSPGAAKMEMQRRRRSSIYKKAESQERQIEILKQRGWKDDDFGFSRKKGVNPLLSKHERERVSLNITPGTAFMDVVTDALLYFSYRYVSRFPRVRVYINPSSVHGEGEVKLLDWIMHGQSNSSSKRRRLVKQNDTIAILGGDSDLVPMGLVVPTSVTHNLHVILPEKNSKSMVVSVWETSRIMARMIEGTAIYGAKTPKKFKGRGIKQGLSINEMNQARIDTALLIILNGNDYLPKMRGSRGGFDPFFRVYLDILVNMWPNKNHNDSELRPFLIGSDDNNELYLNVPFALAFFRALLSHCQSIQSLTNNDADSSSIPRTQLGTLNNLVVAKILPGPLTFKTIRPEDSVFQKELWAMNSKSKQNTARVIDEVFADGAEIIRLTIGNFPENYVTSTPDDGTSATADNAIGGQEIFTTVLGESDGHGVISRMIRKKGRNEAGERAYLFEVPHREEYSMKNAKYRLACLALEEIFGSENTDGLFGGGMNGGNLEDDSSLDGKPQGLAQADAKLYLGGLLWNLETYRNGCCADYGYDYGRRASPTAFELVDFLEGKNKEGITKIKCFDLIDHSNTPPLSDGLACLAAIPPQAWHVVPEPYSSLVEPSRSSQFEELYDSCFHPETKAFDTQSFEKKCNDELSKIGSHKNGRKAESSKRVPDQNNTKGRQIYAGSKCWTIISRAPTPLEHPFEPPKPFSDRVTRLRWNKRIKATKLPVKSRIESPKGSAVNGNTFEKYNLELGWDSSYSVHDIPFNTAFKKSKL